MRAEFHVHTKASHDSALSKGFLYLACRLHKIKCIAICDHNEVSFALENYDWFKRKGIEVIIGEEIFTRDGEIIGLFLNNKILPGLSALETVNEIKAQNGLVYIPHPYDEKRYKTVLKPDALKEIAPLADFIEIHNGRNSKPEFSVKQKEIAALYPAIKVVGSDAHTFIEIGRNYCNIDSFNKEDLKIELSKEAFNKKSCLNIFHFITKCVRGFRKLKKGDFRGLFRAVFKKCKG